MHINSLVRPGSHDLQELFWRRPRPEDLLANYTAVGVGYTSLSAVEHLVLAVGKRINSSDRGRVHSAWGEDIQLPDHDRKLPQKPATRVRSAG